MSVGGIVGVENNIFASGTLSINSETGLNNTLSVEGIVGVGNNIFASGTLSINSETGLNNTLSVGGVAGFQDNVYMDDNLSVSGNTAISLELSVGKDAGFDQNVYIDNYLSVSGHTTLDSTLSVTGATNIENTLYLKQNGWIRESIVNNKTDRYVDSSDGNDNEGIQVRNIEANRKTYLSSRNISENNINLGVYNVFTLEYKNSSNEWIILDANYSEDPGTGNVIWSFIDGGSAENTAVFIAQSNLSGNRIYHNKKDDTTAYGLKLDTTSSSVLTTQLVIGVMH